MGSVQVMLQDYIQTSLRTIFLSSVFTPCLGKKACSKKSRQFRDKHMLYCVKQRTCTALLEFLNPCSYSAAIGLADEC